jgi:predicted PurR-regulated permease PerM
MDKPFRISITNVLQILALGVGIWLLYLIKDVLIIIFIAWIASTILQPIVDRLQNKHIPRSVTASILVAAVVGFLILFVIASIPLFTAQIESLVDSGPEILNSLISTFNFDRFVGEDNAELEQRIPELILEQIGTATESAISVARLIADSIIAILVTSFLTFYFLTDKDVVKNLVIYFSPNKKMASEMYSRIEDKLRVWMRGQGIIMILIGVITYIGLLILGVEYALPLAVFAGFLEIVPFIGPTLSAIPAFFIALTISPVKAFSVLLLYFIIQQLEASIVVPRVMNKAVGLNPIIVILAVMIGGRILGPAGALLSIPMAAIFTIGYDEYKMYRGKKQPLRSRLGSKK